ncbi:TonB-dependent receptor [Ferruginibacter sp. SUN106]|uniref:TonB-dependent receptor n=1 Tax=Ferruginibacter sp. SUN106 TaxID=2978348 RepID=UPI003D36015A
MRKFASYAVAFLLANVLTIAAFAQNVTVSGNVRNSASKEGAGAVSVTIKGASTGTFTDDKGNFKLSVKSLPVTLLISSVGYELQEVTISSASFTQVEFKPTSALGQEVVVSATRVPQKILESPVSIERVSAAQIRSAPAANFYDVVMALKGVDVTTSSLTFKTPTTRGFNSSGNTRFNQLVDGMDNQAPGLNFSVGAIIGLSELDVDNIELLSGASSALYGPGGMNGTLLMTSKNPFKYQGLSFLVKEGMMNTDGRQRPLSPYHNWNLRWGKKVSEKFAFKINAELIQAKDWQGTDSRNYSRTGTTGAVIAGDRKTDPNYDGINVYGDETTVDIRAFYASIAASLPGAANFIAANNLLATPQNVSRTGYSEKELLNPNTINFKLAGSLHYKLSQNTEAVLAGYWGTGNTVYTGSDRYSLKDFKMGQYKLELNNKNWSLRAYTTQENAGESYNATATTRLFNESWKKSVTTDAAGNPTPLPTDWYIQYAFSYLSNLMNGMTQYDAQQASRALADVGRPTAGTPSFNAAYDAIRRRPISQNGGLLLDKSDLYSVEGNYNLTSVTKDFADILVGANYKKYVLNSQGTLFADSAGTIGIATYGAYIQATRQIIDRLKLTVSGRYDKMDNFKGRFTPRVTALVKLAENNNLRFSYQTAYRFPSSQQQYINLQVGSTRLIGSNPTFANAFGFPGNPLYTFSTTTGSSTLSNFKAFNPPAVKPESVSSFEVGYKGLMLGSKLLIDVYGYYGQYQDFTGRVNTIQTTSGNAADTANPSKRRNISVVVNSTDKVKTYGFGLSVDYRLPLNFTVGANVASDVLKDVPANFVAYFNAPKYKANASFGNSGFGPDKRMGFNVAYRWQQAFYYQGDFASGNLPDVHTLDAQISVKLPKTKSIIKLGANNLLNQYYYNAIGNSQIGGLYYLSFGYNVY